MSAIGLTHRGVLSGPWLVRWSAVSPCCRGNQKSVTVQVIRPNFDVVEIAKDYERHGAACLSCLTDESYFQGSDDYLRAARALSLPVLRKDFVIDAYQVDESFVLGADCVLLIAAILPQTAMGALYSQAVDLGLDVLIEVHDQAECEAALALSPMMLGINNRNLHDFSVDLGTTHRLLEQIPSDTLVVESD